jgi:hypothetical protein
MSSAHLWSSVPGREEDGPVGVRGFASRMDQLGRPEFRIRAIYVLSRDIAGFTTTLLSYTSPAHTPPCPPLAPLTTRSDGSSRHITSLIPTAPEFRSTTTRFPCDPSSMATRT